MLIMQAVLLHVLAGFGVRRATSISRLAMEGVPDLAAPNQVSLFQRTAAPGLSLTTGANNITLTFTPDVADTGTYTLTIADVTPTASTLAASDFNVALTQVTQPKLEFTLLVTSATAITNRVPDPNPTTTQTAEKTESVSGLFIFPSGNNRVHYQVTKGNGTLYVGTSQEEYTTPTQDLLTHQSSSVWINMNNTTNEVTVSYAGQVPGNRRKEGSISIYWHRGSDNNARHNDTADNASTTGEAFN